MPEFSLQPYYEDYLLKVRRIKPSSVKHYVDAIVWISRHLLENGVIDSPIFEHSELPQVQIWKAYLQNDPEYIALDTREHNMYSVGFNHYCRFVESKEFYDIGADVDILDKPIPVENRFRVSIAETRARSIVVKKQSMESAHFECEVDHSHATFISRTTGSQYMEGHHIIPLRNQDMFDNSLDVYSNVICLCPICHRLLHYGRNEDRGNVLHLIYGKRADRLANSGLMLSENDFIKIAESDR